MKKSLFFALAFFSKVGIVTALPLVSLGLLGRYLDRRFGTSPKLLIALMILAFVITLIELKKLAKEATEGLKDF